MTWKQPESSWTAERVEKLAKLWAQGNSAAHIAATLGGTTRNAVIAKVHRLGIQHREASKPQAKAYGPRWTEERDAELSDLYRGGYQDIEIAAEMGIVSANAVAKRRAHLGLLRQPAGGFKAAPVKAAKLPKGAKPAKPQLIVTGNGTVMEKPPAQPPKASADHGAWAPLLGVAPMLREYARDRHCKWPITVDGDELSWCCSAVATEGSYCKAHARKSVRVNQPEEIKKAKRRAEREKSHARMIFGRAA